MNVKPSTYFEINKSENFSYFEIYFQNDPLCVYVFVILATQQENRKVTVYVSCQGVSHMFFSLTMFLILFKLMYFLSYIGNV